MEIFAAVAGSWNKVMNSVELEWVPDPAQSLRPEEKVSVNKPNTRYHPGSNLGKARELFDRLDRAQKNVGYAWLQ